MTVDWRGREGKRENNYRELTWGKAKEMWREEKRERSEKEEQHGVSSRLETENGRNWMKKKRQGKIMCQFVSLARLTASLFSSLPHSFPFVIHLRVHLVSFLTSFFPLLLFIFHFPSLLLTAFPLHI